MCQRTRVSYVPSFQAMLSTTYFQVPLYQATLGANTLTFPRVEASCVSYEPP